MTHTEFDIWQLLATVPDPEVPVLSVIDLGIVRAVATTPDAPGFWRITITPTYSGCPAMHAIEQNINEVFAAAHLQCTIHTVLAPSWTTDWISAEGRKKLLDYGIAPPQGSVSKRGLFEKEPNIICPRCKSDDTVMLSQFGSTACKALHQCKSCAEPFDYFKCL